MKKILRLIKPLIAYTKGKIELDYMPLRYWIEAASSCNLRCTMCPNKDLPKKDLGQMEIDVFFKIIDQIKGTAVDIALNHRGEALLHPKLPEMIRYAADAGLTVKLHTNGTLLDKKMAKKILSSGLDTISFSFDGFSKDFYEKTRVGADYEKTLENIRRFIKARDDAKKKHPKIVIELIRFTDEEVDKKNPILSLGADRILIKEFHNWGGSVNSEDSCKEKRNQCTFPWYAMIILWDGRVCLCPQDFFGKIVIGDAKKESLKDIWNSKDMQNIRKRFKSRDYDELSPCTKCDRICRKTILGIPREYLAKFIGDMIK